MDWIFKKRKKSFKHNWTKPLSLTDLFIWYEGQKIISVDVLHNKVELDFVSVRSQLQSSCHTHMHTCMHNCTHARTHARTHTYRKRLASSIVEWENQGKIVIYKPMFVNFLTRWVWSFAITGRLWSQRLPMGLDQQMLPLLQAHERNQISISASLDWFGPFLCPNHNYVRVLPQTSTVWVFVLLAIASSGGGGWGGRNDFCWNQFLFSTFHTVFFH